MFIELEFVIVIVNMIVGEVLNFGLGLAPVMLNQIMS